MGTRETLLRRRDGAGEDTDGAFDEVPVISGLFEANFERIEHRLGSNKCTFGGFERKRRSARGLYRLIVNHSLSFKHLFLLVGDLLAQRILSSLHYLVFFVVTHGLILIRDGVGDVGGFLRDFTRGCDVDDVSSTNGFDFQHLAKVLQCFIGSQRVLVFSLTLGPDASKF